MSNHRRPGPIGAVLLVNSPAVNTQGCDPHISGFDASLRGVFPLGLKPGESLVSTASVDAIGEKRPVPFAVGMAGYRCGRAVETCNWPRRLVDYAHAGR